MSQLNIKSLWIQQIKMNNENITKSIEKMVTDIKIELNQEENQLYEEIIRKIRENSKEINQNTELEMPQEGSTECEIPEEINGKIEKETNEMEKLIQELETPVIENEEVTEERTEENIGQDNIKELVGMFYEIERINRKQIRKYYEYARKFEKEKEEIKRKSKKRISDKTAKSKLYEEMKEQIIGNITRITLRKRKEISK